MLVKMLVTGPWADKPGLPIINVVKIGQVIEVSEPTAKLIESVSKGVILPHDSDYKMGDIVELADDEKGIAEAFEMEREFHKNEKKNIQKRLQEALKRERPAPTPRRKSKK
jgi:hypothetical protein